MKLILLFLILSSPSYALVEEHKLLNEPCPIKALSISNNDNDETEKETKGS